MAPGNQKRGHHHHSGQKQSIKSRFVRLEQFFFRYGLAVAGTILLFSGLIFILISKISSGYFSNAGQWILNGIPLKPADPVQQKHVVYLLPSLMFWFIITVSGLGILKPSFRQKYSSLIWDSVSYLTVVIVILLTALMIKVTGISRAFLLYESLTAAILIIIAILNERFCFLKGRRAFHYIVCITSGFFLPFLMLDHFFVVLAASLAITILVHSYIFRSRTSLVISKALFLVMAALYLLDWSYIIHAYGDLISGGDKYPFHMLLSAILVTTLSYFYLKFKSFLSGKYPYLERQTLLPADIPERIFPFLVFSSCLLLFDFSLITVFPGYPPNLVEPVMFSFGFIVLYNYLKPAFSKPGRIFRIVFSYLALILYPAVINPEINRYRYMLIEGRENSMIPFMMHYACIILMILLLVQSNKTLRQIYYGENKTRHFRFLMVVILLTFLVLTEYDHLSLLLFSSPDGVPANEMIILNKFLPYSILLILVAVSLLIYSRIRYSLFLRRVSLSFIVLAVLKIFMFDLKIVSENTSVIILISLGLALILIALVLQVIRKKQRRKVKRRKRTSSRHGNDQE
jgi:hypothetical protein